jgi:DNA-binding transcriptional regulator YiaG
MEKVKKQKDKLKELFKIQQLKEFRERVGLTQGELSKALSVANNTVSRWELGQRSIPEFLPLALETIERRLSNNKTDSTAGSKTVSTVGSSESSSASDRKSASPKIFVSNADNQKVLTFADVVLRLGKSESSVRRYLKEERLKGEKLHGEWKILQNDFAEFENSAWYKQNAK